MAKMRASEWVAQQRAAKVKSDNNTIKPTKRSVNNTPINQDYGTGGAALAAVSITCLVYLSMVIANGAGDELLTELRSEKGAFKFIITLFVLNFVLTRLGQVGRGLMALIIVGALLEIGPDAAKNANKLIDLITN
jgi:hypothetical protein